LNALNESEMEQSVLVRIVKVPQNLEEGRKYFVLSTVRLEILENLQQFGVRGKSAEFGGTKILERPFSGGTIGYWERNYSPIGRRRCTRGFVHCNSVDKVVKSRAQIVDGIPKHEGQSLEVEFFGTPIYQFVSGEVSIALVNQSVQVLIYPGNSYSLDGFKVSSCAL
jgi:hypothetical protein